MESFLRPHFPASDIPARARRLPHEALETPFVVRGASVSASVGIASAAAGRRAAALLDQADAAMYRAERGGGNCVVEA
ncbi:MAG: hypothetical protein JWP66_158 [Naasia sp.]|nr:hypothetical protein [Naasia sp.]